MTKYLRLFDFAPDFFCGFQTKKKLKITQKMVTVTKKMINHTHWSDYFKITVILVDDLWFFSFEKFFSEITKKNNFEDFYDFFSNFYFLIFQPLLFSSAFFVIFNFHRITFLEFSLSLFFHFRPNFSFLYLIIFLLFAGLFFQFTFLIFYFFNFFFEFIFFEKKAEKNFNQKKYWNIFCLEISLIILIEAII